MLPASFLLSVAVARTGIVIPVALEVLLMEFQFELLKEAGDSSAGGSLAERLALSEDSSSGRRQSKRES